MECVEEEDGQVESNSKDACEGLDEKDEGFYEPNPDVDLGDVYCSTSSSNDDEVGVINVNKKFKGKIFQYDDNEKGKLAMNQIFVDVNEFKQVLKDYIIQENFNVTKNKNEKTRVTIICVANGFPLRVHASPLLDVRTYMIKTY